MKTPAGIFRQWRYCNKIEWWCIKTRTSV